MEHQYDNFGANSGAGETRRDFIKKTATTFRRCCCFRLIG